MSSGQAVFNVCQENFVATTSLCVENSDNYIIRCAILYFCYYRNRRYIIIFVVCTYYSQTNIVDFILYKKYRLAASDSLDALVMSFVCIFSAHHRSILMQFTSISSHRKAPQERSTWLGKNFFGYIHGETLFPACFAWRSLWMRWSVSRRQQASQPVVRHLRSLRFALCVSISIEQTHVPWKYGRASTTNR